MRRALWIAGTLIAALAAVVVIGVRVPAVQDALLARVIEQATRPSAAEALFTDDALRVLVCGSSSPLAARDRARPCVAVIAGGRLYVVDIGTGSWNNMALWRVPGERIGGVFLTHFHSDHIGELGEWNLQTWIAGRGEPLAVYGPEGVERVVAGFNEAYALDHVYRTAHHGADFLPPERGELRAARLDAGASIDLGELRVTAIEVNHEPIRPAVGYRFEWRGRSVVVSGDTARSESLAAGALGADVLLHEAQANHILGVLQSAAEAAGLDRRAKILFDIRDYHTTPVEAAEVANAAGVRLLVLYHLIPPPPNAVAERVFMRGVADVRPGVVVAHDGLVLELPAGSDAIRTRSLE